MLHMSERRLIILEGEVHQHIMVGYLVHVSVRGRATGAGTMTRLRLQRELLHEGPRLLARPRQVLRVLEILAKCVLADLAHAARDNILDRLLNALSITDLVYKLRSAYWFSTARNVRRWEGYARSRGRSHVHQGAGCMRSVPC